MTVPASADRGLVEVDQRRKLTWRYQANASLQPESGSKRALVVLCESDLAIEAVGIAVGLESASKLRQVVSAECRCAPQRISKIAPKGYPSNSAHAVTQGAQEKTSGPAIIKPSVE